jgi:hypothetical protein
VGRLTSLGKYSLSLCLGRTQLFSFLFFSFSSSVSLIVSKLFLSLSSPSCDSGAPTKSDAELLVALDGVDLVEFPHLARWYKHIASFHEGKRSKWVAPSVEIKVAGKFAVPAPVKEEEDDDFDVFGDDTEDDKAARDEAAAKMKEASAPKKKVGKSEIVFDVKPWEAETDMEMMETSVRAIVMEGLHWGGCMDFLIHWFFSFSLPL